jgi:serine protease Do
MKRTILAMSICLAAALRLAAPAPAQDAARAYLGVYLTELSEGTRMALGLEDEEGVLVERVTTGGPAQTAGMQEGDIILEIDGRRVSGNRSLQRRLDRIEPDAEVEIVVWRKDGRRTLKVKPGKRSALYRSSRGVLAPDYPGLLVVPPVPDAPEPPGMLGSWSTFDTGSAFPRRLGVRVQELTGQLAEYFEVSRGVLVTWVTADSPAARAGLKAGDVVVSVGGQPIQGQSDLRIVLGEIRDEEVTVKVVRRGKEMEIPVQF